MIKQKTNINVNLIYIRAASGVDNPLCVKITTEAILFRGYYHFFPDLILCYFLEGYL